MAIAFPIAWTTYLSDEGNGNLFTVFIHASYLFDVPSWTEYLIQTFMGFPIEMICRMLPVSLLAILAGYQMLKRPSQLPKLHSTFTIACWVVLINLLPYWVAPKVHPRYILPLYPFIAFMMAYLVWQMGGDSLKLAMRLLWLGLIIKFVVALAWFPYDQTVRKGDALAVANDILLRTKDHPLYVKDSTSTGLRVVAEINRLRSARPPLLYPPRLFNGFVINQSYIPSDGQLIQMYQLGTDKLYLQCLGDDCFG